MSEEEAWAKALDLLAARQHFALELSSKLARRGFDEGAVDSVIGRLRASGYLDDAEAALSFARERTGRRGWGPRRLAAELGRRGVDEGDVRRAVEEVFPEGESAAVRAAAERWLERGGRGRERLARFLDRRGFSKGAIIEILSRLATELDDDHEEP